MTKLRPSLKNSARTGFSLLITALTLSFSGCSSSTTPTYLKENADEAIQDICRKEYDIDVKTRWAGKTLWVYLPLEDIIKKADKPEKYLERFTIEQNNAELRDGTFDFQYLIKAAQEQEKTQEVKYNETALKKVSSLWRVMRRVLFSMESSAGKEPEFLCVIAADIKNGFSIQDTVYYLDLKKVSYDFISWEEYLHRSVQTTPVSPEIIGDKEGLHIDYKELTLKEFIIGQIQHRIKLKFQKPEVEKGSDIDKEILKIIVYTFKTYGFTDFSSVELNNLLTSNRIVLNQKAVLERVAQ